MNSCKKDDFSPDLEDTQVWQPEIAFPLVFTELSMSDLARVNDSSTTIAVDNEQFCTLVYQGEIFRMSAQQLMIIPDQGFQNQFSLNNSQILTLINSGQVQFTQARDISLSMNQGAEIDSIVLKQSQLSIELNTTIPSDAEIRITVPGLTKNGIPFTELITFDYSGSIPMIKQVNIPLNDYHLNLTKNGTTTNTLEVIYTITMVGNGNGVTTSGTLNCNASIQSIQYQVLYGYIGQQSIGNLQDSVELSIFNNAIGTGSFFIADPKIRFDISNSIGIPFHARVSQLTALNANLTDFSVASGVPDPLPVNSPGVSQIGQTMLSNFTLDNSNSNISSLINESPKYLIAESQISTNPQGRTFNFITDSSNIAVGIHVELPLHGTAKEFIIKDTVPFNYFDLENVEALTLRLNIENWFPIESNIQIIFTDENYLPLDTIFSPGEVVIPSGIVPSNQERVTQAGFKIHDQSFDNDRIQKILGARKILIQASASTYQQGGANVKIFNDYKLKVKIGAIVKMKIL